MKKGGAGLFVATSVSHRRLWRLNYLSQATIMGGDFTDAKAVGILHDNNDLFHNSIIFCE